MPVDDGGPAFPLPMPNYAKGMSLLDYFAGQALNGWLSGPCAGDVLDDYEHDDKSFSEHQKLVAKAAYGYADSMIAEKRRRESSEPNEST